MSASHVFANAPLSSEDRTVLEHKACIFLQYSAPDRSAVTSVNCADATSVCNRRSEVIVPGILQIGALLSHALPALRGFGYCPNGIGRNTL